MENNDNIIMSRIAFERIQAKDEKNDKWRNIIIIVLIAALILTNGFWIIYESQYETVDEYSEIEMDTGEGGDNNYIGHNGDINNGTNGNQNKDTKKGT